MSKQSGCVESGTNGHAREEDDASVYVYTGAIRANSQGSVLSREGVGRPWAEGTVKEVEAALWVERGAGAAAKEAEAAVRVELRKLKEQVDADAANAGSATEQLRALRDVEAGGELITTTGRRCTSSSSSVRLYERSP